MNDILKFGKAMTQRVMGIGAEYVCVCILLLTTSGFAQEPTDSTTVAKRVAAFATDKLTITRPLNVEFTGNAPYNFITEEQGRETEHRAVDFKQAKISVNHNFIKGKSWYLGATLAYKFTTIDTEAKVFNGDGKSGTTNEFHHFISSVNFTYLSTFFGKRAIYSSSFVVDASEESFERAKGFVSGIVILKADRKTKMTVGLFGNIDPTTKVPVIPIFTYETRFENGLIVDITLPKSVYLRKNIHNNGRLSLGSELDGTYFYVKNIEGASGKYEYRQLDINSGVVYEFALGDFVITGKTGVKMVPSAKVFKKENSFRDSEYSIKPDPSFYLNLGVSFNPFTILGSKS